jgi:hypothetical protein
MVDSWRPPITEVHGLASHGQAVRSMKFSAVSSQFSVFNWAEASTVKTDRSGKRMLQASVFHGVKIIVES